MLSRFIVIEGKCRRGCKVDVFRRSPPRRPGAPLHSVVFKAYYDELLPSSYGLVCHDLSLYPPCGSLMPRPVTDAAIKQLKLA